MGISGIRTVNIYEAKTQLSRLVEAAANGEPFVIAKAGKPMVLVTAVEAADRPKARLGFLEGGLRVPDDFDRMGEAEIADLFGLGDKEGPARDTPDGPDGSADPHEAMP